MSNSPGLRHHRVVGCAAALAALFSSSVGFADEALELARRVSSVMAHERDPHVCKVDQKFEMFNGKDAKEGDVRLVSESKIDRGQRTTRAIKAWENGTEVPPDKTSKKQYEQMGLIADSMSPFDEKQLSQSTFSLLGDETLWGHPVRVLHVHTVADGVESDGKAWVDAATNLVLREEYELKKVPMLKWMKLQAQYQADPSGFVAATFRRVDLGGTLLFKKFRAVLLTEASCAAH
jgi:hypothetical protein